MHALHPLSQAWPWSKNLLNGIAAQKHRRSKESCYRLLPDNAGIGALMRKSLIAVLLPSLLIFADGYFYSAHAQCSAWDKISCRQLKLCVMSSWALTPTREMSAGALAAAKAAVGLSALTPSICP